MDPRAKLVGVLLFVVVAAVLTSTALILVSLGIATAFAAISRVPPIKLARSYLTTFPFIMVASASVFLFGGFEKGLNMLIRVSACVLGLLVLAVGTDIFDLFSGLRRLKLPAIFTALLMLTYRYLLLIVDEYERMKVARRARGFAGGRSLLDWYGFKVLSQTAGMVLVRSSSRADRIYEGLKARAFKEDMASWRHSVMALTDAAFITAFVAASALLLAFQMGAIA